MAHSLAHMRSGRLRPYLHRLGRVAWWAAMLVLALLAGALAMRAWMSTSAPDLQVWHTLVPDELDVDELDRADWAAYAAAEERVFREVDEKVAAELHDSDRAPFNRYYAESVVYPGRFAVNWNRSFVLAPGGDPVGVVVLLHGLTDSPYSLRHVAEFYRQHGFVALGIRLPAHGTVPGALTHVGWPAWMAAVRLAMREASKRAGDRPIHLVGYSNGGALAMKYALDALDDDKLPRPDRVVLLSPMIGVHGGARFAGIAGWPAILPAFSKTAWLDNLPEFNPFKYNSFPVRAARESYLLTDALQDQVLREKRDGRLARLPPILTFQSIVDATVLTRAVVNALYAQLPANGSELVLFDINRNIGFNRFIRQGAMVEPGQLLPTAPRAYRVTIVGNVTPDRRDVAARTTEAGETMESTRELGLEYPPDVFSLSHIALPFPVSDALYGLAPSSEENFGLNIGTLGVRGERGVLLVSDSSSRISSNPFFPYVLERIGAGLTPPP